jgi:hypothetical protein
MRKLREVHIQDHRGPTEFASSQYFSTFTLSPISQSRSVTPAASAGMKRAPVGRSRAVQNRALADVRPGGGNPVPQQHTPGSVQGRGPPCAALRGPGPSLRQLSPRQASLSQYRRPHGCPSANGPWKAGSLMPSAWRLRRRSGCIRRIDRIPEKRAVAG